MENWVVAICLITAVLGIINNLSSSKTNTTYKHLFISFCLLWTSLIATLIYFLRGYM